MKNLILLTITIGCLAVCFLKPAKSQVVDIKKWTGTYPDMEESYPLAFIAFKGWLIPIPYAFVRTWPTHYYIEVDAMPVTDATEIAGSTKTGLLRIAAKMLERCQMEGRHDETVQIKDNTNFQKQIGEKIFNSRTEQLEDLYRLAQQFIKLYQKVDKIGQLPNSSQVKKILEKEADQLLMHFLMVNLLQTDHGEKLDAFSEINSTLNKLLGEVDYTWSKIHYFSNYNEELISYSFLTQ